MAKYEGMIQPDGSMLSGGDMSKGSGSLFDPNQLSLPGPGPGPTQQNRDPQYAGMPDDMYKEMMAYNKENPMGQMSQVILPWNQWMSQQGQKQQAPDPYGGMTPGQALGGELTQTNPATGQPFGATQPTPAEQLNTPSFEKLAQPMTMPMPTAMPPTDYAMPPPPSVSPVPVTQPTPGTSNLIQQIQAPVAGLPPSPATMPVIPVSEPSPGVSNLIQQIQAPTTPRPVAQPNRATQQFAQQFRPQPVARPRPVARPQPVMAPRPMTRPQPQPVMATRPIARSLSRVNPPLLPTRPMGRR